MIKKVDANQAALVKRCRQVPGVAIVSTHTVGHGMVDIILGYRGFNYMIEIKDGAKQPSQKKLTPDEVEFHRTWPGQICIAENFDDILKLINRPLSSAD